MRNNSNSSRSNDAGTRVNRGATTRGNSDKSTTSVTTPTTRRSDSSIGNVGNVGKATKSDRSSSVGTSTMDNNRNKSTRPGSTTKPNGDRPNGNKDGNGKPGNIDNGRDGGKPGNGGNDHSGRPNSNRPNGQGGNGHGGHGGNQGFNHDNHFDYTNHHYRNDFHKNYTHHSWSWSRPLPPPVRRYRPAPIVWYRPVIPVGWHPYAGAPIIDRILGITFGTLFDSTLDYLYYNGYEIDGYADHVIYLRNVPLLNLSWEDVMLCYDEYDRLVNAQFIFQTGRNDRHRYNRVYNSLCRIYGQPINSGNNGLSWYGGDSTGWVTLSTFENLGRYYTTLSIGY